MKTSDLESFALMPSFASYYAFACKALDAWMSSSWARANVFGSPWSLEAIRALTDEELEAQYKLYSVLPYFPDLDRENRNQLLYLQNALRQRTTCADSMQKIIRYLANGTFYRVIITISGDFLYDITLYSDYINFSDDIYKSIINACRELVRPSQQLLIFDAHTYEMDVDSDVWALAIVGEVKTPAVNCVKAIRLGMDASFWTLAKAKHLVDAALVEIPALATPSLIGETRDFYHTQAEFIKKIKLMYTGNSSGNPWVYDGTFGIYRLGAPDDIWRVYADGRIERYE
jgi:hypothetical protein